MPGGGTGGGRRVFLYDITSVYLDGEHCPLAALGYNRDGIPFLISHSAPTDAAVGLARNFDVTLISFARTPVHEYLCGSAENCGILASFETFTH